MWREDGEDETFRLESFEGQSIVVLDLWATWCGPCVAGLPHLSKLAEKVTDQGVTVIALNSYDDEAAYRRFVSSKRAELPGIRFARDPAGRERDATIAKRLFRVTAIPATYVIDKNGTIVAAISGYREGDRSLATALEKLGVKVD
jgi:thiol-disulfide isomerase/thioredoxin